MRQTQAVTTAWQTPTGLQIQRLWFAPREQEVLWGLSQGASTRQLAETLCLSVKTIGTYYRRLRQKVGIKTGEELRVFSVYWSWYMAGREASL